MLYIYGLIVAGCTVADYWYTNLIANVNYGSYCGWLWPFPSILYRMTHINMPACMIVFMLTIILSPIMSLIRLCYWLAHLGR